MSVAECAAFTLVPIVAFALLLWSMLTQELPLAWSVPWAPSLGIELVFRLDGLSALMLLLITGVGIAVFVYAGGYLAGHPHQRRLYIMLTAFMMAMIGCVTADDLFLLFVFWELTGLTSFALIGFHHEDANARKSAQQALLVTASGGLAMFAGFIVLTQELGTSSISAIVAELPRLHRTPGLTVALVLIMIGAFAKSAQLPFHFWLPNAMSAPTPVSAYLHSATMVKLGVYLLARLDPGFGDWAIWQFVLQGVGSATAGWAMVLALRERDLKRILAWSTVATLGALVLLVGMQSPAASVAVAALLLAHALYKAPLFFVAGNVDHGTGTRQIDRLGNLRRKMPWTAAAALLAGLSMAGIPLTFGFIAKDMIYEAKKAEDLLLIAQLAYAFFGAVTLAVAGVAAMRIFWWHPGTSVTPKAHECGASLVVPPLVLAALGVLLGIDPRVVKPVILSAAAAMPPSNAAVPAELLIDYGSMIGTLVMTLSVGAAVYAFWDPLHRMFDRMGKRADFLASEAHYARILKAIPRVAAFTTRFVQHGRLPQYLGVMMAAVAVALATAMLVARTDLEWPQWTWPSLGVAGACATISLGAILAAGIEQRLVLMLAAGLVGYGSALFFLFAGAPDVAFTQLIVETVFVIVVASVLLNLKRLGRAISFSDTRGRPGALLISVAFATVITLLFLFTTAGPIDPALADYFAAKSVPDAHGRNVVNVILVDFRALDTLGESTVVMLSLLAVLPILRALKPTRRRVETAS